MNTKSRRSHSKPALRVKVAKDVLLQIRLKKYKPTNGTYCKLEVDNPAKYKVGDSLQAIFPEIKECTVCGLGAVFMSLIHLTNDFALKGNDTLYSGNNIRSGELRVFGYQLKEKLTDIFTEKQIADIEACFEGYYNYSPTLRLQQIMKSIIEHKGGVHLSKIDKLVNV